MDIYQDKRWKRKREWIIQRDEHTCQECKRYGKSVTAAIVHHIKPIEDYPELWLSDKNLISVCGNHHNGFHDKATNKLTKNGKALVKRIWGEVVL